jgi:hypothetical protein
MCAAGVVRLRAGAVVVRPLEAGRPPLGGGEDRRFRASREG